MSGYGSEAAAARASHEVARQYQRELDAKRDRTANARERAAWDARQRRLAGYPDAGQPQPPAPPGASALALAEQTTPEWRAKQARERLRRERAAERRAIHEIEHPRTPDPRSTAQKLADGAGQANLDRH